MSDIFGRSLHIMGFTLLIAVFVFMIWVIMFCFIDVKKVCIPIWKNLDTAKYVIMRQDTVNDEKGDSIRGFRVKEVWYTEKK